MLLSAKNQYTTLEVCSPGERRWLSQYLAFEDPKARFRGNPREQNRMFDSMHGRFPTGFLRLVQKAAREENWNVDVIDRRERPCEVDWEADLSWLRDYQQDAVDAVVGRLVAVLFAGISHLRARRHSREQRARRQDLEQDEKGAAADFPWGAVAVLAIIGMLAYGALKSSSK